MATRRKAPARAPGRGARLRAAIEDVVVANRILADQGVLDAYGHVSARHPDDSGRFLLSRSLAPELVTAADVMEHDLDGHALDSEGRAPYLERFIHAEVYRSRPDVMAVVHSHSSAVIPFACSSVRLRPIFHMAAFLGNGPSVFDIRRKFGPTDLLVRNGAQGRALAAELGPHSVVLMRGHGFVAVGPTIPLSVYRAIYTQVNAGLQESGISLGGRVTYLDLDEAKLAQANVEATIGRPWELWKKRVVKT